MVVGVVVLLLAGLAVRRDSLSGFEADLFRLVNDLPSGMEPVLVTLMQAGNVAAAPALGLVVVAFNRKRLRAVVDVSVAGAVAWFAAKAVKAVVERPRPTGFFDDVLRFGQSGGLGFVSGHTAVAAAIATAAAPYLPRRWRRVIWVLPWIVGFARVYVGAHLPLDIVGGAALGWVVGASAHLLVGAPHRVPDLREAARVVGREAGEPLDVEQVEADAKGSFPFVAVTTEGRIFIKLLDPEPRDRDWIYRAARYLTVRDLRDEAAILDAPARAYREAAMTLLARSSGARVPAVRGIERDGGRVWIVQEFVPGRDLTRVDPSEVGDAALRDLWIQLGLLRSSRLAHRDLVAGNIVLDDAGALWLVDLAHAVSSAPVSDMDNDAAELLVTTSVLVGPVRAGAAALDILGRDGVIGALGELQPLALTPQARRALALDPTLLGVLRRTLEAAIGVEPDAAGDESVGPSPRGAGRAVALAAIACGALVSLAGPDEVADALTTMSLRWVGVGAVAAAVATIAAAWSVVAASGRRLAIGRTALVQMYALTSSVLGGAADDRVMARYLSRSGVASGDAFDGLARIRRSRWLLWSLAAAAGIGTAWEERVHFDLPPRFVPLMAVATAAAALAWLLADRGWFATRPARGRERGFDAPRLLLGVGIATGAELATTIAGVSAFGPGPAAGAVVVIAVIVAMVDQYRPGRLAVGPGSVLMVVGLATAGMPLPAAVSATLVVTVLQVWGPVVTGRILAHPLRAAVGR